MLQYGPDPQTFIGQLLLGSGQKLWIMSQEPKVLALRTLDFPATVAPNTATMFGLRHAEPPWIGVNLPRMS